MKIVKNEIIKKGWKVMKVCKKCNEITEIKKEREFEWYCQSCYCIRKKLEMRKKMLHQQTSIFDFLEE